MPKKLSWVQIREIERVTRPDPEVFINEYVKKGKPVVLAGLIDGWRALESWTPGYLESKVGDRDIKVTTSASRVFRPGKEKAFGDMNHLMKFRDYVKLISPEDGAKRGHHYVAGVALKDEFSGLCDDLDFYFFNRRRKYAPWLWFGPKGTVMPLHKDPWPAHNIHAVISGRKQFILFDPEQSPSLYPHEGRISQFSRVNIERPNFKRFPELARARPRGCVLGPGDILFMPAWWWHQVYSLDETISVNVWWIETMLKKRWPAAGARRRGGGKA